jgi:hypothetical protein
LAALHQDLSELTFHMRCPSLLKAGELHEAQDVDWATDST